MPIGKFEGVQERLARIAGNAYLLDAGRRLTCAGLDLGHHPSVISALLKSGATERMRVVVNDAMDVHGGKAVIEGPRNYMGSQYRAIPVGITVEGANILTRSLMVFGQGAIRAHPFLLQEILAIGEDDHAKGLAEFDAVFWKHVAHSAPHRPARLRPQAGPEGGLRARRRTPAAPAGFYRRMGRYSAAFALTSDIAPLTLGGALKRKEMLSGRLGDILAELYFLSAALKRWEDEGRQDADFPLLQWHGHGLRGRSSNASTRCSPTCPTSSPAGCCGAAILPLGPPSPRDRRTARPPPAPSCCWPLGHPRPADRERLCRRQGRGRGPADRRLRTRGRHPADPRPPARPEDPPLEGRGRGRLGPADEIAALEAADKAVAAVIAVDDFAHDGLATRAAAGGVAARPAPIWTDGVTPRRGRSRKRTFSGSRNPVFPEGRGRTRAAGVEGEG